MCTRREILNAADTLFAREGFDATSIRDIAQLTGLNKSLVHYHYKNKEDLLVNLLDQYYAKLFQSLQEALLEPGSFKERVLNLVNRYGDFLAQNKNFSRIFQREAAGGKHVSRIRTHMLPFFNMGVAMLQQAYPCTHSGPMAAEHLLVSIYGMIVTYFSYSEVLEPLFGPESMSEASLNQRKIHLQHVLNLIFYALETQEKQPD